MKWEGAIFLIIEQKNGLWLPFLTPIEKYPAVSKRLLPRKDFLIKIQEIVFPPPLRQCQMWLTISR